MSVLEYMQKDKYNYTWTRDNGDGEETDYRDKIRVDKDEGYEVEYFIEDLIQRNNLKTNEKNVHLIENALHSPKLSSVVMRDELEAEVENILGL